MLASLLNVRLQLTTCIDLQRNGGSDNASRVTQIRCMVNHRRKRIRAVEPKAPVVLDESSDSDQDRGLVTAGDYAERITACWQKAVASIIETGTLLIQAKAELAHGQFEDMINEKLPFSVRMAQNLMRIAAHPILANPKHVSHLPPSWGTLHALTQLPNEELELGLANGTINSEMERKDVIRLGYTFERVAPALTVLTHFMENFPDSDPLVDVLVRQPTGNWVGDRLFALSKLPVDVTGPIGLDESGGRDT